MALAGRLQNRGKQAKRRHDMKNQFVGDFAHFHVYRLLKALSHYCFELGVCQMVTEDDRRSSEACDRNADPALFDALQRIRQSKQRIAAIRHARLVPDTTYFPDLIPGDSDQRGAYFQRALSALSGADVVLFEPDCGLRLIESETRANCEQWLFPDEAEQFIREGASVLFPPDRSSQRETIERLAHWAHPNNGISSLRLLRAANCSLIFAVHRAHADVINARWDEILRRSGWEELS